jgi:hypothetical protein
MKNNEDERLLVLYTLYILGKRYRFSFGPYNLERFLLGNIFPTVKNQNLYIVPTYGSLRNSKNCDIRHTIQNLIEEGYLINKLIPNFYSKKVLVLTKKGKQELSEKRKGIRILLEKYFKAHYLTLVDKGDKYLELPKLKEKNEIHNKKGNEKENISEIIDEKNIHLAFKYIEDDLDNITELEGGNGLTPENAIKSSLSSSDYSEKVHYGIVNTDERRLEIRIIKSFFKIFNIKYTSIEYDNPFFDSEYEKVYHVVKVDNNIKYYFDVTKEVAFPFELTDEMIELNMNYWDDEEETSWEDGDDMHWDGYEWVYD